MFKMSEEARRKNLVKQKRWQARHRDVAQARATHRRLMAFRPPRLYGMYRVIELYGPDEPDLPRYVAVCRIDREALWHRVWQHRDKLTCKLAVWFRMMADSGLQPVERIVFAPLQPNAACRLCALRIQQIARMAGTWPDLPDFLCNELPAGRGCRQPVTLLTMRASRRSDRSRLPPSGPG